MRLMALAIAVALLAQEPAPTFRSGVDVIVVPVSVMSDNRPVIDLKAEDFELLDRGVLQKISVARLDDLAIDVTLVLDASASVQGDALARMKRDAAAIGDALRASDRVRILTFGDNVSVALPFTSGGAPLPVDRIDARGATSLYAGLAASLIVDPSLTRPQLVFALTDGRDNASLFNADSVLQLAGRSRACLYLALVEASEPVTRYYGTGRTPAAAEENTVIRPEQKGVYDGATAIRRTVGPYSGGPNLAALKGIAARTGGAVYDKTLHGSLADSFRRALDDFRTSYLLSYTPSGVAASGWHDVTVKVRNRRYAIRARKGYDG
jgi:VWFA-related protein